MSEHAYFTITLRERHTRTSPLWLEEIGKIYEFELAVRPIVMGIDNSAAPSTLILGN